MNMETTPVDIDALAARFLECTPLLPAELATQAGLHVERVEEMLRRWPGVFFDKQGRIQGYWGLAIAEMKDSSKWRERLGPQCANFSSSAALCRSLNLPHFDLDAVHLAHMSPQDGVGHDMGVELLGR